MAQISSNPAVTRTFFELEVVPGLGALAGAELQERHGDDVHLLPNVRQDRVPFQYSGEPRRLLQLQRSVAVSRGLQMDIPRPKALLGHQNFETLIGLIETALALHEPDSFQTFYISAAGSDSSVFRRIKAALHTRTGLESTEEMGDLLLAVRRPQRKSQDAHAGERGWEITVRLSPRPLSARAWRICDMPGALNATVANTMMGLTQPSRKEHVVNLACGSGTLLIERLEISPAQSVIGCDIDVRALDCAQQNLIASGYASQATLVRCDGGRTPLPDAWATTVCADLPFGQLMGSHEQNERLYPRLINEAARITRPGAKLVIITQEVRLFERVIAGHADRWIPGRSLRIRLPANTRSGHITPRIFLLQRR